jgi:hypothetical protein
MTAKPRCPVQVPHGGLVSSGRLPPCARARGFYVRRSGRDLVIVLPVTTNVGEQILLRVDVHIDVHMAAGAVRLAAGVADIGVGGPGGDHHLLDGLSDLFLRTAVAGGQLPDGSVHIGLAPELR